MENKVRELENINSKKNMESFIEEFRVVASNHRNNQTIFAIIDRAIQKCKYLSDQKSLVKLYEIKISQIEHSHKNFQAVLELVSQMKKVSKKINYTGGLALAYNVEWYIEKYKGNKEKSKKALDYSMKCISQNVNVEEYDYYACNYSFAIESWLTKHDKTSSVILEKCADYFLQKGYYRSLALALGVLIIIYQQTQNKEKSLDFIKKILNNHNLLNKMPEEIQSIIHFFIGFNHELSFNLKEAEKQLLETQRMLGSIYRKSIYSGYYLTALSYLTSTYALQGKLELSLKQMKEVEKLIEEGIATKNLDSFSKEQMVHIFNLTKFYIHSRLQNFLIKDLKELVHTIHENIDKYHSNAMFFSEFLLNANLTKEQLIEIKNLNNPSTKRVEHIINFLIAKITHADEKDIMRFISKLKVRTVDYRMTFVEKAFADLLAAQEYYKLNRFAEIYPLLKKYENNLHKIEVLEMRVFMEAFIQVGAYKNGDPLGPALQYLAIKKCRQYGFSKLEFTLLNYLDLQGKDTLDVISINRY